MFRFSRIEGSSCQCLSLRGLRRVSCSKSRTKSSEFYQTVVCYLPALAYRVTHVRTTVYALVVVDVSKPVNSQGATRTDGYQTRSQRLPVVRFELRFIGAYTIDYCSYFYYVCFNTFVFIKVGTTTNHGKKNRAVRVFCTSYFYICNVDSLLSTAVFCLSGMLTFEDFVVVGRNLPEGGTGFCHCVVTCFTTSGFSYR